MGYLTFPRGLLTPRVERWAITGQVATGGQSSAGITQTTNSSGGGFWTAALDGIWMRTVDQVKAWRALEALLDGGVTGIIVPLCDAKFKPIGPISHVPHSDGSLFDDDAAYASGAAAASFAEAAALRATRVKIALAGGSLSGGEHFTVNHVAGGPRLYRVARIHDETDGVWDVSIRCPLRAAVAEADAVDFDNPRLVMKLASPEEMGLTVEMGRQATGSVRFVEAFGIEALSDA